MKKCEFTQRDLETMYTALRLELHRNWGGDPEVVAQLQAAMKALEKYL